MGGSLMLVAAFISSMGYYLQTGANAGVTAHHMKYTALDHLCWVDHIANQSKQAEVYRQDVYLTL